MNTPSAHFVCNCTVCGKRYVSNDIRLKPRICISCWLDKMEAS